MTTTKWLEKGLEVKRTNKWQNCWASWYSTKWEAYLYMATDHCQTPTPTKRSLLRVQNSISLRAATWGWNQEMPVRKTCISPNNAAVTSECQSNDFFRDSIKTRGTRNPWSMTFDITYKKKNSAWTLLTQMLPFNRITWALAIQMTSSLFVAYVVFSVLLFLINMEMQCHSNIASFFPCAMVYPFEQEFLVHLIRDILVYNEMLGQTMIIVRENLPTPSCNFKSLIQAVLEVTQYWG